MRLLLFALTTLLALTSLAGAHHSISGMYNTSRDVKLEGTVTQFRFIQPHPFLLVDVLRNGVTEQWHFELDNRFELAGIGITESTLKPGDRIVVSGSPAYREQLHLYVQRLERPADGFGFEQVNNTPRLRAGTRGR
jgi:hypothetical protein